MDQVSRNRRVTGTAERFIAYHGPAKYYVFRNLGPAKVSLTFWSDPVSGDPMTYDIRGGDSAELYCSLVEAKLTAGESFDASILEWIPVG